MVYRVSSFLLKLEEGRPYIMKIRSRFKEHSTGYLFIAPLLIVFALFFVYSLFFLIRTSFYQTTISFRSMNYVGWNNFKMLFTDHRFLMSILNNLVFSIASILISITIGFLVAVFLHIKVPGKKMLHALFFIPSLMPMALIATVFSMMLESQYGTLNTFFHWIGMDFLAQPWLSDPKLAYMSVISVSIFLIGIPIMYYSADLTTLSPSLLESAVIDGAGMGRIIVFILFPILKNSHKTIILSMLLTGFREFERIFLMTQGGPAGSTENTSIYIYTFMRSAGSNMGFVSAASLIVLAIAIFISIIQLRITRIRK
jgi:raffinose/stachyose/melibiose transport system permease protein